MGGVDGALARGGAVDRSYLIGAIHREDKRPILTADLQGIYTQPEWPLLTEEARTEVVCPGTVESRQFEGGCQEPAVRACPSQPSHGRRPATGAPHGRMPPQPPIARRPHMALSLHTPRPRQPSVRLSQRKRQKVQPPTAVWLWLRGSSGSAGRPTPSTAGLAIAPAAMSLSM